MKRFFYKKLLGYLLAVYDPLQIFWNVSTYLDTLQVITNNIAQRASRNSWRMFSYASRYAPAFRHRSLDIYSLLKAIFDCVRFRLFTNSKFTDKPCRWFVSFCPSWTTTKVNISSNKFQEGLLALVRVRERNYFYASQLVLCLCLIFRENLYFFAHSIAIVVRAHMLRFVVEVN